MNKLPRSVRTRRTFDPSVKEDIDDYRYFARYKKWRTGGCPFYLDWPYLTVPDMIKDRVVKYYLKI